VNQREIDYISEG